MSVGFSFYSVNSSDNCSICLQSMADTEAKTHEGPNGSRHTPFHKECIKSWIALDKRNFICPLCKDATDPSSLFTWKDRAVIELNHIKNDAYKGAKEGLNIGIEWGMEVGKYAVGGAVLGATLIPTTRAVGGLEVGVEVIAEAIGIGIKSGTIAGVAEVFAGVMREGVSAGVIGEANGRILVTTATIAGLAIGLLIEGIAGNVENRVLGVAGAAGAAAFITTTATLFEVMDGFSRRHF